MSAPCPPIQQHPLPYVTALQLRPLDTITLAVIHCTELPDLATARTYGQRVLYPSGTGDSGHYYIDRNGHIEQYVPPERIAHHVRNQNAHTLGIELVNRGRYPHWLDTRHQTMDEPYPAAQIQALIALLTWLIHTLPALNSIAGHDTLDTEHIPASDDPTQLVPRKHDPGPLFPWDHINAALPHLRHLTT
ncbi:N-acetylmuramoyl-L-alanine amidase [Xylella fastidiosa subsp. pauca]|uniref:N-acetylmuramoyl-L-alanine amidase n=1 Tax=Xylella fastidiosa TaxID=2371 RepID=UPI000582412E|nr:N-acetylmuramoyl-L-alanine amidase [Xylella fastidiosa]ARO69516.1 N-acetylmuramoyl-L-alanine amidase [Xylella fastidiosa subsp. pauca]KIA57380.1 N-acetylmuramoyl-L-alanine amidase [Xylella fastidiosa]KXB10658.1 N-acetylmuramoyl-L-alanine amidase [Xylella fastidiosa]KXB14302.1 N-acetylmuramoyl-L-alanine amidase [Xylella fastidiosa]KXB15538.1 N-acetylmuramoyl-L-alanine amidase [Xylella fastidiosa]